MLKAQARYLLKVLSFWLLLFQFGRLCFVLYFFRFYREVPFVDLLSAFAHALRLDAAMAAYLLLLPIVAGTLAWFFGSSFLRRFNAAYHFVVVCAFALITVADIGIYHAWGMKLNHRAVSFLAYPKEAAASIDPSVLGWQVMLGSVIGLVGWMLYRVLFRNETGYKGLWRPALYLMPLQLLVVSFIVIVMLRGGLQRIPINESAAYFSSNQRLNHASVNTVWYVAHSVFENREHNAGRMFNAMSESKADSLMRSLFQPVDSMPSILSVTRPNVVFIQLESFTADVVEALGGEKNVTPNLDTLIQNGLLFTNVYAPGFRTDQGLVSLLCAFPAQPTSSIIKQADKIENMPSVARSLRDAGYATSFYYGGELGFGNIKAFLLSNGFHRFSSVNDYPAATRNAKWGTHDEHVFQKQANDMNTEAQPFFSYLMTLSSHEPFDVPGPVRVHGTTEGERFMNSCAYTDHALDEYFKRVSKEPWFNNTLFVLCADHGHALPRNRPYNEPPRFHVPLLFFGPALKNALVGQRVDALGTHMDIAATLLGALGLDASSFTWSNNL
ncbi:MAG TPA: sulfatase-like hydrolase/transferase, partial [Chitinophagales bacterium]|nr:sulfatase-like hydrolase/transferase [Chitinophagales bacterium]